MIWRPALGAAALALTICCAASHAQPIGYEAMMAELKAAAATGRVRVARIGTSVAKRPIPLVVIGPDNAAARVLVLCRQHGDEPVSTEAAMRIVRRAVAEDRTLRGSLHGVQLLILPMLNPDGAQRFTRLNANGVDLNRDWILRSQPETRAVAALFHRLAPQVVLDEHEWTAEDACGSDSLETTGAVNHVAHMIQRGSLSAGNDTGVQLKPGFYAGASDPRLAHRYFQSKGAEAFLLETTPAVPANERLALYGRMIVRMGHVSALYAPQRHASAHASELPRMFEGVRTPAHTVETRLPALGAIVMGAFALLFASVARSDGRRSDVLEPSPLRRVPLGQVRDLSARLKRRHAHGTPRASLAA